MGGDEDLPPSWDDVLQEFGDTNGDGVVDQREYEGEEYESGRNMEAELMTDVFGETMVTTTSIKGTWEASDDRVTLTRVEEVYEFNSLTLGGILHPYARCLVPRDGSGIRNE